jgi:glucose/arabinose dehydrogenase
MRTWVPALLAIAICWPLAGQTPLQTVRVATGLQQPTFACAPPGDEDRLFIAEKNTGRIVILRDGALLPTPYLDIGIRLSHINERGLLSFAFHPEYATNGHVYVHYTRALDGAIVVERFTVSPHDPDAADPNTGLIVFGPLNQGGTQIHIGGTIAFRPNDPANYLYISTGDAGLTGDPSCNAQNGQVLFGKILRVDIDPSHPTIPPTNPFVGNPSFRGEIWAYGLRNPWRMSFDRATGDLYIGDVGEAAREEISFLSAQSPGGENYGWKIMEGTRCYSTENCFEPPACGAASLVPPIHEYAAGTGGHCAIGGYVYRGCAIPSLVGTYVFGDYSMSRFWSFRYDGDAVTELQERTTELTPAEGSFTKVVSFAEDGRGELYIINHLPGELYKIVAAAPPVAADLGFGKVGGNGEVPLNEVCGRLDAGESAQVILRRAPAATTAAWFLSATSAPIAFPFGTLVPGAPQVSVPFLTDATGRLQLEIPGGFPNVSLYTQWVILDAGASAGMGFSNALRIDWP